jgi:transposase
VHVQSVYHALTAFHAEGSRGLCPERRGPPGAWKVTPTRRGKILAVAFQHGTVNVEAIATTLKEEWHEDLSTFSIGEVLRENGLSAEIPATPALVPSAPVWASVGGQLTLSWGSASSPANRPAPPTSEESAETGMPTRRPLAPLSQTERLYLAQLREGSFNTLAGGLLYVPFLARAISGDRGDGGG